MCNSESTSWLRPHIYDVLCYNIATNTLKSSSQLKWSLRIISRLQLIISSALYSVLILFSPSASSRLIWASWSWLLPELGLRLFLDHKLVSVTKTYIPSYLVEKLEIVLALINNHKYLYFLSYSTTNGVINNSTVKTSLCFSVELFHHSALLRLPVL